MARVKGWWGEFLVRVGFWWFLNGRVYWCLHDLVVEDGGGRTQIDHVCVSRYGIFVVETKNYSGEIVGDEWGARWTQVLGGRAFSFQNPLRQNYRHTRAVSRLLGVRQAVVFSVVVFCGDAVFRGVVPGNVARSVRGGARYIRSFRKKVLSEAEVRACVRGLGGR